MTREVEWDEWQRSLALALIDLENDTGSHGHLLSEATDPTALDPNGEWHYAADVPRVDAAAIAQDRARKAWIEEHGGKDADTTGVTFPVRKVMARTD